MQKNEQKFIISDEKSLDKIVFSFKKWEKIFFYWDLGAGKTTFIRALLRKNLENPNIIVRSPTYTYYQEYSNENFKIFHFDLYRLEDLETFYLIGWTEIAESEGIMLVEWPEIIEPIISPNKKIFINYNAETSEREIVIQEF